MRYDKDWYDSLNKPKFQPPAWVFAPVWTVLYFMMAVAFLLIIRAGFKPISILAYLFFALQLYINLSWSGIFFKEHNLRKAFLYAVLLAFLVFITTVIFFDISLLAGLLLLPYLAWCLFASLLSFEILELNED